MLTPEEVSKLREIARRKREKRDKYVEDFKIENEELRDELIEIKQILQSNDLLRKRVTDYIDVGTKFRFKIIGEKAQEAMLVEEEIDILKSCESPIFIGKNSDLGKELIGKKTSDFFEKRFENGNVIIWGQVEEIKKDASDYMHYIRENEPKNRISKEARRKRRVLNEKRKVSAIAQKEWENRNLLTKSQVNLLQEEAKRLLAKTKMDPVEKGRLKQIKKLLSEAKVASLPNDNCIGIGSQFSIAINTNQKSKTLRVEFIRQAVSNELKDEYIEEISPMGTRLLGLTEGDTVYYISPVKGHVSGTVFDIDNVQKQVKTNDATTYQRKNHRKSGLVVEQVEMLKEELLYKTNLLDIKKEGMQKVGYPSLVDKDMKKLKQRIAEINNLLTTEEMIENPGSDMIQLGSKVSLNLDFGDGEREEMNAVIVREFVGHEASTNQFISLKTDLGEAIYGKKEGEEFCYSLPTGFKVTGEIMAIEKQTEKVPLRKSK